MKRHSDWEQAEPERVSDTPDVGTGEHEQPLGGLTVAE